MNKEEMEKLKQAGKIAAEAKKFARTIIKKDTPLVEIANRIESKIEELGGKPAFPVNLSINEVAAHYTPSYNDEKLAHGLLKIDIGAHIDGYIADTAFSLDLEDNEENKNLIKAAKEGLKAGLETIKINTQLKEIGKAIESKIKSLNAIPIQNLSGHSLGKKDVHAGITIPNYDNSSPFELPEGTYAIEPFATTSDGAGSIKEGKPSGIYKLEKVNNVRDRTAREILKYIIEEYETLPFCSRWLYNKFGAKALIALKRIEEAGILHSYPQLIEKAGKNVAQAENTVIITDKDKIITTE